MIVIGYESRFGTVGVLHATDDDGKVYRVAADWRPFDQIAAAFDAGEEPEIEAPSWAILSGPHDPE